MQYIRPFVLFGPTGSVENRTEGDEAGPVIKDFRPKNYERDFPVTPAVVAAVEGTVPADALVNVGASDPKEPANPASSATESALGSASESSATSTQDLSKGSSPEPQSTSPSVPPAPHVSAEKAKTLHPSTSLGKTTPHAVA